jgi:hypothetical protein
VMPIFFIPASPMSVLCRSSHTAVPC